MFKPLSRKNILGSLLACIGFLLSPLSWWNDIFINIPLAYLMAVGASTLLPGNFSLFLVLAYWLTNVVGLILMHKGYNLVTTTEQEAYSTKSIIKDLFISLIYSFIIAALVLTGILKLPTEYF